MHCTIMGFVLAPHSAAMQCDALMLAAAARLWTSSNTIKNFSWSLASARARARGRTLNAEQDTKRVQHM